VSFLLFLLESWHAYCRTQKLQVVSDAVDDDDNNNSNNNKRSKIGFEYEILKLPLPGPGRYKQGTELYCYSFLTSALDRGQWSTLHPNRCTAVTPRSTVSTGEKRLWLWRGRGRGRWRWRGGGGGGHRQPEIFREETNVLTLSGFDSPIFNIAGQLLSLLPCSGSEGFACECKTETEIKLFSRRITICQNSEYIFMFVGCRLRYGIELNYLTLCQEIKGWQRLEHTIRIS